MLINTTIKQIIDGKSNAMITNVVLKHTHRYIHKTRKVVLNTAQKQKIKKEKVFLKKYFGLHLIRITKIKIQFIDAKKWNIKNVTTTSISSGENLIFKESKMITNIANK